MKAAVRFLLGCLSVFAIVAIAQILPFGPVFNTGGPACGTPVATNEVAWFSADCITLTAGVCSNPANGTVLNGTGSHNIWSNRANSNDINSLISGSTFANCVYQTGSINGLPSVNFASNCGWLFNSAPDTGATSWSIFVVWQTGVLTTYKGSFTGGFGFGTPTNIFKYWNDNTNLQGVDKADSVFVGNGTASTDLNWHQMNVQFQNQSAGNTLVFRLDRASDGPSGFTPANMSTPIWYIGIDRNGGFQEALNGNMAELIIYAGTGTLLSGSDITANETYLNCRYGL